MKRSLLSCLVPALLAAATLHAGATRTETSLDHGWLFHFGTTASAETASFDTTGWQSVDVPHTWNAFDGQDGSKATGPMAIMGGDYKRGDGWYRRTFATSADWSGREVYLQFDGANRRTDVYVNGQLIGTHLGGHARFRFDVTHAIKPTGDNLLAVKVNNETNGIMPQSGDFTSFGGLYRDVSVLVTDPIQVETMDHASPGVFLTQHDVSADSAQVEARVELANHSAAAAAVSVHVTVADAGGQVVSETTSTQDVAANGTAEVRAPLTIGHPHLWNGRADPYLYKTKVELSSGGKVTDAVVQPLGLRFYRVDPQQGFFLNGKYLDLHGVARHQDRIDKGWAISPADEREDMALIAEMGCTAIRVAHYQQSQLWYHLADEKGIVMWAEVPFVGEAFPAASFGDNAVEQMKELIRQNYNHPAICFWGCGNENLDAGAPFIEGIAHYMPLSEALIKRLNDVVHQEDKTRLSTYASFHSEDSVNFALPGQKPVHYDGMPQRFYTDVTAFNKYYGWYYGEPDDSGKFLDKLHAEFPDQRIAVSEFGAGACITQHEADTYGQKGYVRTPMDRPRRIAFGKVHPEEYQAYYHEETWKALKVRPFVWAKFCWNMFDFASDGRNEGDQPGRNDKGLVTFDRKTRKDAFYFYKANWSTEPVLHVTSSRFIERKDPVTEVKAYSNAPEVELFLNGQSLGKQTVGEDHIVRWTGVRLQPGDNAVKVVGAVKGAPLSDECSWHLASPTS